jgi:ABC-type sugar transport system permease subunit
MSESGTQKQEEFRTAVTMTVVWVAGLTLIVIFAALFAGLWLDKTFHSKPIFTIVLMIASIPVTLFLTFRVVKAATSRIKPVTKKEIPKEESHRGQVN